VHSARRLFHALDVTTTLPERWGKFLLSQPETDMDDGHLVACSLFGCRRFRTARKFYRLEPRDGGEKFCPFSGNISFKAANMNKTFFFSSVPNEKFSSGLKRNASFSSSHDSEKRMRPSAVKLLVRRRLRTTETHHRQELCEELRA